MPKDKLDSRDFFFAEALNRIDGRLDRIDDRLERMDSRMDENNVTLAKQNVSLEEHVRRTNLLETRIEAEAKSLRDQIPVQVEAQLKERQHKLALSALKVAGVLLATGGGGVAVKELVQAILKVWGH